MQALNPYLNTYLRRPLQGMLPFLSHAIQFDKIRHQHKELQSERDWQPLKGLHRQHYTK